MLDIYIFKVRYTISYILHPQVHSISVTSPTPLHLSLFLLVSSFVPISLFWLIFVPMSPWSSHPLHIVFLPHSCFPCFTLVPLFLVPDQVNLTLQHRTSVKFSRSPSDCRDSVRSKIDPLPLLQLCSDHPPRLQYYANQTPELWVPPEPSDTLLSLSELRMTLENPDHISVFICLHHSILVLLNSKFTFMSSSQFSPFRFRYIKLFQYSRSLILASTLPSYISASLLLNSSNSL